MADANGGVPRSGEAVAMIHYHIGDALDVPPGSGPTVIAHVCNNRGGWGAGFTGAISRRWSEPERLYRSLAKRPLGTVAFACVGGDVDVANMIAQDGYSQPGKPAIHYEALFDCLTVIAKAKPLQRIQMPRIGCGLAGGVWSEIENIIENTIGGFDVHVYDLNVSR